MKRTIAIIIALGILIFPMSITAAIFNVVRTDDTASPCVEGASDCSLRGAVIAANANPGSDLIILPAGEFILSISGTDEDAAQTGDLDITDDITFTGAGADETIVNGNEIDRVFDIFGAINVEMANLTIEGGKIEERNLNIESSLLNSDSGISSSESDDYIERDGGGGIRVNERNAVIVLSNLSISRNMHYGWASGILNNGDLIANNCIIMYNRWSMVGAGIHNEGNATLNDCAISGNEAEFGGGVSNYGNMTLNNCTISHNVGSWGGGIYGRVTANNCTISNNFSWAEGGGIHPVGGEVTINNCTISENKSEMLGGGIFALSSAITSLTNTILAGNTVGDGNPDDCSGTIISYGHNVIGTVPAGCTIEGDTTGNIIGVDPKLGPLADNGGPTMTHALLEGSPAIDAGDNANCLETDQRGIARPIDGDGDGDAICDIGAYEFMPQYITVLIDIKPGSYPNSINLKSKGKVPVAILTTDDFDAYDVDPDTCVFANANPLRWRMEDVDSDGDHDMLFHFMTRELDLTKTSTEATLVGETIYGDQITGTDSVNIAPKGNMHSKKAEKKKNK